LNKKHLRRSLLEIDQYGLDHKKIENITDDWQKLLSNVPASKEADQMIHGYRTLWKHIDLICHFNGNLVQLHSHRKVHLVHNQGVLAMQDSQLSVQTIFMGTRTLLSLSR
jgi:hypothetical protein